MRQTIKVRHQLQMAHRLPQLPGKCQKLHGHTWTIVLALEGAVDKRGIMIDYAELKKRWRDWLDETFDHQLALAFDDPIIKGLTASERRHHYPGLVEVNFHPTVENLSSYWAAMAQTMFGHQYKYTVEVWEGENNCAIAQTE
jgi:6-pyruvoyltetrahydropterin/6-carboxytetrahydropterin synthase